jgi:peptide/nickel transport system substrate-binding protein
VKGHLDGAEMLGVADANARQSALLSGEVDLINRADLKTAHLLSKNKAVSVEDVPGRMHYNLPADARLDPFTNLDVRLALKYAIDRDALVKTILFGHGQPGNDQPITPSYRYFAKDLAPRLCRLE